MTELELRSMPIESLVPAPYNPRKQLQSTDSAYLKLKKSLQEFGLVEPLIWNELSGNVVGGHLRLQILCELGFTSAPVSVVRLSPEREKALNIMLNNHEAQGRFHREKLAALLEELQELPELELSGFDRSTLRLLRFEPGDEQAEPRPARLEVSFIMDATTFAAVEEPFNQLIRQHDLEVQVKAVR